MIAVNMPAYPSVRKPALEPPEPVELEFARDTWQLDSWESYRDVARLGRKTWLPGHHRKVLWAIFDRVHVFLSQSSLLTEAGMFSRLTDAPAQTRNSPFDFAVVDDAQDISVTQLRFFAALGVDRANALFFAGDLGQRIFQQLFSWKTLGVLRHGLARFAPGSMSRGRVLTKSFVSLHEVAVRNGLSEVAYGQLFGQRGN